MPLPPKVGLTFFERAHNTAFNVVDRAKAHATVAAARFDAKVVSPIKKAMGIAEKPTLIDEDPYLAALGAQVRKHEADAAEAVRESKGKIGSYLDDVLERGRNDGIGR